MKKTYVRVFSVIAGIALLCGCKPTEVPVEAPLPRQVYSAEVLTFKWQYEQFLKHLVAESGRVIDATEAYSVSTSEGQAYGMWFAVLADDPLTFERILRWTEQNLAKGALGDRLSAWQWGRDSQNKWHILDDNAAADADIWMAYALFVAAERWQIARYHALANRIARRILEQSSVVIADSRILLPAPTGFMHDSYILVNPSYFSLTLFRGLASYTGDSAWLDIYHSSLGLLQQLAAEGHGVIPDWLAVDLSGKIISVANTAEQQQTAVSKGDYDAIRTYLWLTWEAPTVPELLPKFSTLYHVTAKQGFPPERLSRPDGVATGRGSIGFSAIILSYLNAIALPDAQVLQDQTERIISQDLSLYQRRYYERMLMLFGVADRTCIVFMADGRLNIQQEVWDACR